MIAPMKRCTIVMSDKGYRESLDELRSIGLVHLSLSECSNGNIDSIKAKIQQCQRVVTELAELKIKVISKKCSRQDAEEYTANAIKLLDKRHSLLDLQLKLAAEDERFKHWENVTPEQLRSLLSRGLSLKLALADQKAIPRLDKDLCISLLAKYKGKDLVAIIGTTEFKLPERGFEEIPIPPQSRPNRRQAILECQQQIMEINSNLISLAEGIDIAKGLMDQLSAELHFEEVAQNLAGEGRIRWLRGWIPASELAILSKACSSKGWGLVDDDPADDEMPPTKVVSPVAIRIIQPVFNFLGMVPNYREYDISALFLLFFCIFVAMIIGDAGYGSLLLLLGSSLAIKSISQKKHVPDFIRLLLLLSVLTIVWGGLTVCWFGIDAKTLPVFLQKLGFWPISNANPDTAAVGENVKIFCFLIGTVQLGIAHFKNIIRDRHSLKLLGQLGSLLMVLGMYFLVLNFVVSSKRFPLPDYSLYLIASGFGLVFLFGSWTGNILTSVLESLKNFISLFLGTVSIFADIVSYIRLWAVGLAGVALSQTINNMGKGLFFMPGFLKVIGIFAGLLLFGLGHGLNLTMSGLSVIVHGVRLNLLEFSGHLGMEWSGYNYDPFRRSPQRGA